MGAQQRVYRQRIRSVQATKKITRAMELIAASRVVKAREAVAKSTPYAVALTRAVSSVASSTSDIDHALTTERENVKRAGVLIVTADRGLAGSYSVNAMKEAQQLITKLEHEGKEVVPYLVGRKGVSYYKFRRREYEAEWTGFTDSPKFENAEEIGERLTADFHAGAEGGGVDELHVVYTEFQSMVTQQARVIRLLPLEVAEGQLDLDGDGYEETYGVDTNGDGYVDTANYDTNGDGYTDVQLTDTNGDGYADIELQDTNGDGYADVEHYDTDGDHQQLEPGMTLTVEPMINIGEEDVIQLDDGWTVMTRDGSLSAQWEHTLLVTETGVEVLTARSNEDLGFLNA